MSAQQIIILFAAIFFAFPFIIWTGIRFRTRIQQRYIPWHRIFLLSSFLGCFAIAIIFIVLAITLF